MNRHLAAGLLVGGIFAAVITWVAAHEAFAEGVLHCCQCGIRCGRWPRFGGLIAANFAMLTLEEREMQEAAVAHREAAAHSAG